MMTGEEISCAGCGRKNVRTKWIFEHFDYGSGKDVAILSALIPVRICRDCGAAFTDHVGDKIKERTIRDYLMNKEDL